MPAKAVAPRTLEAQLDVRHGPEGRDCSTVDCAVVNSKPVHSRKLFRDYEQSGYLFGRRCVLHEPELDKHTDVTVHNSRFAAG